MVTLTGRLSELAIDMSRRVSEKGSNFSEGLLALSQGGRDTERDAIAEILARIAREERVLREISVEDVAEKLVDPLAKFFTTRAGLWVSPEFTQRILALALAMGETTPATVGTPFNLPKNMTDAEICKELGNGYIFEDAKAFCVYLADAIERQWGGAEGDLLTSGYANLFYVRGVGGEVFVVHVDWRAGGRKWLVHAFRLDDRGWHAGNRAFPCN